MIERTLDQEEGDLLWEMRKLDKQRQTFKVKKRLATIVKRLGEIENERQELTDKPKLSE